MFHKGLMHIGPSRLSDVMVHQEEILWVPYWKKYDNHSNFGELLVEYSMSPFIWIWGTREKRSVGRLTNAPCRSMEFTSAPCRIMEDMLVQIPLTGEMCLCIDMHAWIHPWTPFSILHWGRRSKCIFFPRMIVFLGRCPRPSLARKHGAKCHFMSLCRDNWVMSAEEV